MRHFISVVFIVSLLAVTTWCIAVKHNANNAYRTVYYQGYSFDIYEVDLTKEQPKLYLENETGEKFKSIGKLEKHLRGNGEILTFATNAGMYLPRANNEPEGLYIANAHQRNAINLRDTNKILNFYMKPNGVFMISKGKAKVIESHAYDALNVPIQDVQLATQSGPMLLIDNNLHPKFNKKSTSTYIRSGVGTINETNIVFAISNERVNFYTFASLFREVLQCNNALYLDGAISRMHLPALNRIDKGGDFGGIIAITKPK